VRFFPQLTSRSVPIVTNVRKAFAAVLR